MNKKGGLVLSAIILIAVFVAGFVIGYKTEFGKRKLSEMQKEKEKLENTIAGLQEQINELSQQQENQRNNQEDIQNDYSCSFDEECVLKSFPYCCANNLGYFNSCYHTNEQPPEDPNCEGVQSCPAIAQAVGCKCENNKCKDIHSFDE